MHLFFAAAMSLSSPSLLRVPGGPTRLSVTILQHLVPLCEWLSRKFHTFHFPAICRVFRERLLFAGLTERIPRECCTARLRRDMAPVARTYSQRMDLVTGATGYVGGRLVERLVREGRQVRALARDPSRLDGLAGIEAAAGDLV